MHPSIQKHIFSVMVVAAMFVVALIASLAIVVVQTERDSLNAEVCRMEKRIKELENKSIVEEKQKLDSLCAQTRLRTRAVARGNLHDMDTSQVVHVRLFNVPYGRASANLSPRDSAIALASLPARRSVFSTESESSVR